MAEEGDLPSMKEFGDRFEGKIPQGVEGPDGKALVISVIERVIVREK